MEVTAQEKSWLRAVSGVWIAVSSSDLGTVAGGMRGVEGRKVIVDVRHLLLEGCAGGGFPGSANGHEERVEFAVVGFGVDVEMELQGVDLWALLVRGHDA